MMLKETGTVVSVFFFEHVEGGMRYATSGMRCVD